MTNSNPDREANRISSGGDDGQRTNNQTQKIYRSRSHGPLTMHV